MIYLFTGQDSFAKDGQIKELRQKFLPRETAQFNYDLLYAQDLTLAALQEKLLCLPVNNALRIVCVKSAQRLKPDIKSYLLGYARQPYKHILLVLDADEQDNKDVFLKQLPRYAKVVRFKELQRVDTFTLTRQIELRKTPEALRLLQLLLDEGEKPERILGGLRYAWARESVRSAEARRRIKLLLVCDRDIKTGKLKPTLALERLVIALCGFGKLFHQPRLLPV